MEVVLVNLGVYQEYILHSIHQIWIMGNRRITVLCETEHIERLREFSKWTSIPIKIVDLSGYKQSPMMYRYRLSVLHDPHFRDNFWNYAWQRFIVLYEYMRQEEVVDVVHLENDIAVYVSFDSFREAWKSKRVWITMDSEARCIPGIVYLRDAGTMDELLFRTENMAENDMVTLRNMYVHHPDEVGRLPITPEEGDVVFDAAAIGQYLGGIDPRNSSWKDTRGYISPDCVINYSRYSFEWRRENDLWRPYIGDCPIATLHIHSKRMDDFNPLWPLEQLLIPIRSPGNAIEDIIQGEKIQSLATLYVGRHEDLMMNPNIREETSRHLDLDRFDPNQKIWNPPLVFVYTLRLQEFLVRVLPCFLNRFILLCHNSDFTIDDEFIDSVQPFMTDRIIRICTQNLRSMRDPHFWKPLPIGIQNSQWLTCSPQALSHRLPKSRWIYFFFSVHTNPSERQSCLQNLQSRIEWARSEKNHAEYWAYLSSHHYCICPIGNGVDTHRLWEALLTETCPIVRNDIFYDRLFLEFPDLRKNIYVMESWDDGLPTGFIPISHHLDIHMSHVYRMLTI